jgi:hypothetical protein
MIILTRTKEAHGAFTVGIACISHPEPLHFSEMGDSYSSASLYLIRLWDSIQGFHFCAQSSVYVFETWNYVDFPVSFLKTLDAYTLELCTLYSNFKSGTCVYMYSEEWHFQRLHILLRFLFFKGFSIIFSPLP